MRPSFRNEKKNTNEERMSNKPKTVTARADARAKTATGKAAEAQRSEPLATFGTVLKSVEQAFAEQTFPVTSAEHIRKHLAPRFLKQRL